MRTRSLSCRRACRAHTPERTSVIGAAKLLDELAEAEKKEEDEDLRRSEDISRLRRRLRIVSALISLAFLIALCVMRVRAYNAPPASYPPIRS